MPKETEGGFFVSKEAIDFGIWNDILTKSQGSDQDKIAVSKLIIHNYSRLPLEADSLIIELISPNQPVAVRRSAATEIEKYGPTALPAGLYKRLLTILEKDPDAEVKKTAESATEQFAEPFRRIVGLMANFQTKYVISLAKQIARYQAVIIENIVSLQKQILEATQFLREPEFKSFEFNWLIFLPVDKTKLLYEMHKAGKDDEIRKLLTEFGRSREGLDQLITEINNIDVFKLRAKIIKDAFDAHLARTYTLSIPVLLAQIEGILWALANKKGIAKGTTITLRTGRKSDATSARPLVAETEIYHIISEYLADYFLDRLYTEDFRHGILHGRIVDYASEENSVKLILFVRALLEVAD